MKTNSLWYKGARSWVDDRVLFVSVPFTWLMPDLRERIVAGSLEWDHVVVGGPGAVLVNRFYPGYLDGLPVTVGDHCSGMLQRMNPYATRTTLGCPRSCRFCAVGTCTDALSTRQVTELQAEFRRGMVQVAIYNHILKFDENSIIM